MAASNSDADLPVDALFVASHAAIGLLASIVLKPLLQLPWYLQVVLFLAYVLLTYGLYRWVKARSAARTRAQREEAEARTLAQREEAEARTLAQLNEWKRFELLQQRMLAIVSQFLKERYQVIHQLVSKLNGLRESGDLTERSLENALEEFDKERRTQIKRGLEQLSSFLTEDEHFRPDSPSRATSDHFKVTFYAVQHQNEDGTPNPQGTEFLVPKARAIPNEGEPRTRRFRKGEGASGTAWETKKIVVCEHGGKEPVFKDMWDGGGQKAAYKSMICVPVIEDIASEALSDVYGILTVDTPVREGYFSSDLELFWATLHQPICNLLIYCRESERLKDELVLSIKKLLETPGTAKDPRLHVEGTVAG
jgi:hypothetical protein